MRWGLCCFILWCLLLMCHCLLLIMYLVVVPKFIIINFVWAGLLPRVICITGLPLLLLPYDLFVVDAIVVHDLVGKNRGGHSLYVRRSSEEDSK